MPIPSDTPRSGPLSHIKVLDLTTHLAGPYATMILGDLGAQIIKLEAPGGESTRHLPPHFIAGNSTYFHSINRNKQSIIVDLKSTNGTYVNSAGNTVCRPETSPDVPSGAAEWL